MPDFLATYVDWATRRSDSPRVYHEYAALCACAAAVGNRALFNAVWGPVHPGLYVMLIGPSYVSKTSAQRPIRRMLLDAAGEVPMEYSANTTDERLLEIMAGREKAHGSAAGYMVWPEIGRVYSTFRKDYGSGLVTLYLQTWDPDAIDKDTKSAGHIRVQQPCLTIFAAGKPEWFQRRFQPEVVGGYETGFMGRWLYVYEDKALRYIGPADHNGDTEADNLVRDSLVGHLRDLMEIKPRTLRCGDEAARLLRELGEKNRELEEQDLAVDLAQFRGRHDEYVIKIAMAHQATKGPEHLEELEPESIVVAEKAWQRHYRDGLRLIQEVEGAKHGPSRDSEDIDRVRSVLLGLIEREGVALYSQALKNAHMPAKKFRPILETLRATGEFRVKKDTKPETWEKAP